jgi:hypothetical protein
MLELDAVARIELLCGPGDIGVDLLAAAPGVEIDRLAAGFGDDIGPFGRLCGGSDGR